MIENQYTKLQKDFYNSGTSNHTEHNDNPDYYNILLSDLKHKEKWVNKTALDFACGKGRNVTNMLNLCDWARVDGVDLSYGNISTCIETFKDQNSLWYCNNGVDLSDLKSCEYDFIMSTIALQHIPVYNIRKSLLTEIFRVLKSGGLFSFQMGYGDDLIDLLGRPRSGYYANDYTATSTNGNHDVRIQNVKDVETDLISIGFKNITHDIKNSFSDLGHPKWIYIKCNK